MKTCSSCAQELPLTAFQRRKNRAGNWTLYGQCRACRYAKSREWVAANPLAVLNARLKNRYGIDFLEYDILRGNQGGACAVCGEHYYGYKRGLVVDHDHVTGKVRGLVCQGCNIAIGVYENNKRMAAVARYLESA